jgi:hypothetical protein
VNQLGHAGLAIWSAVTIGCAGAPAAPASGLPPRPEGCSVKLFHEAPSEPTSNIGPVHASCSTEVSDTDCLRTLMDQVCKLGGDVVWGVSDKPRTWGDKNMWEGRAAHTGPLPAQKSVSP